MISIDIGFGNVKTYDGEELSAFPSIYAPAWEGYVPKKDDQLLELDGNRYHIGMTALKMSGESPFDKEDILRHKIFMLAAICEATDKRDFEDEVLLGLPIGDYGFMSKKLQRLKGEYDVIYNGKKRHIVITKVRVYAQSEAVYNLLLKDDPSIGHKIVGIIDIGQKTVDVAYFNEGTFIRDRSGSYEIGVINAYQQIASAVADQLGFEVEDYAARKYIDKVPDVAKKAFSDMASGIKNRIARKHWNMKEIDSLYIVGGGTPFVAPYFKDTPYVELEMEKAVFANAYGYYEGEKVRK